jgi:ABC-type lipoprotein release transport system permease subunit
VIWDFGFAILDSMTPRRLLINDLRYYWRTNLAVVLGVAAATAAIGGALIVGDSVRASLTRMSLDRLGDVDFALTGQRFFREALAQDLSPPNVGTPTRVAPAIVLTGSLSRKHQPPGERAPMVTRAGHVSIFAVDDRFWDLTAHAAIAAPEGTAIVLNARSAEALGAAMGDEVSLIVELPAAIPRDALLGDRNETVTELELIVSGIADETTTQGRFGLNPSQQLPLNAFVSLSTMQDRLGLARVRASRRSPVEKPARVNALFAGAEPQSGPQSQADVDAAGTARTLTEAIDKSKTLADLSLRVVLNDEHGYCALESEQMILDQTIADAALSVAQTQRLQTSPVLVYLVNEIWNAADPAAYSMYAVAAGIEFTDQPPFGPFEYVEPPQGALGPDDIVVNDWLATDLKVHAGDEVRVKYHVVGDRGELPEVERAFRVAGIVKLAGAADDRGFTPEVPGITDVESFDQWRQPFPLRLDRVTPRDDQYWDPDDPQQKAYRATPKIFLPLAAAQDLWRSRYGELTSLRFAPQERETLPSGSRLNAVAQEFEEQLLSALDARSTGFVFQPVKAQGIAAAQGTTDFAGLFVGFSFFLILAAAILIGLLFRLGIERRMTQIGLLNAVGLSPKQVRRLFLAEGGGLIVLGGLLGLAAAYGYAGLMIYGLKTWWFGAIGTKFLFLSATPQSLAIGFCGAAVVALLAIWWGLHSTRQLSTRELLSGATEPADTAARIARRGRAALWTTGVSGGIALLLLLRALLAPGSGGEAFAGISWETVTFFVVGITALVASLSGLASWLNADRAAAVRGTGWAALVRLGLRNAARNRGRSVMTASLIASATFVIVAIAAGHRNPAVEAPDPRSGNGGYTLVAEASVPLLYDLNTPEGRSRLGIDVRPAGTAEDAVTTAGSGDAEGLLDSMRVSPFRVKPGENASCLNLYRTQLPTILGVPRDVITGMTESESDRFKFADTRAEHPWELLNQELPDGRIPVLGDLNTLQYSLHIGIGGTLDVPQSDRALEVVGQFDGSVFQGVLLMSEEDFQALFPEQIGFQYFLIEVDTRHAQEVADLLETELSDYGFDVDRVSERLADFLAVQNTYLSTFQALGGLGLMLGTLGLATVMLRNVLERRGEVALLRAVGFLNSNIALLVLWENACLMLWGLAAGMLSALLAMTPHLSTTGVDVPWRGLWLMLGSVAAVGMLAALAAVREAVRTPIVSTLRGE